MKKIEKAIILLSSFLIMGCSETSSSNDSKISDTSFFQTSEENIMDKYKIVSGNFIVDDKNNFISLDTFLLFFNISYLQCEFLSFKLYLFELPI